MQKHGMKRALLLAVLFLLTGLLSSCGAKGSSYAFSFKTGAPVDSYDEKVFRVGESDLERIKLDIEIKIDQGEVAVQLENLDTGDWLWRGVYDSDQRTMIELERLKAAGEYRLSVQATQAREVSVSVRTETKLEAEADKPGR